MDEIAAAERACAGLGGIARASQLIARGVSRHTLRLAVDSGALVRLREGVYAHPLTTPDVQAAAAHGGMLTCCSALAADGVWVMPYSGLHIAVPRRGRSHPHAACDCVVHRVDDDVILGGSAPTGRALASTLRCRGDEPFFVALESALRQRRVGGQQLAALRHRIPARGHGLLDVARPDADSGLESLVRLRLLAHGIDARPQVEIPGVGRVDLVIGDRLIIELDGRQNHADAPRRHIDLVRDAIAAGLGFETLRFDYAMVMHDWSTVLATVLAKVDAGAHLAP